MANVSRSRTMKILDLVWLHLISRHQTRTYFQLFRAKLLTSVRSATGLVLHVPLGLSSRQDVRAKWERRKSYSDLWYFQNSSIALDSFGCKACWVWGRRWATGSTKRTFSTKPKSEVFLLRRRRREVVVVDESVAKESPFRLGEGNNFISSRDM